MDVFDYRDYREIIRVRIESLPKRGFGQLSQLAKAVGVSAAFVSQVLSGRKNLSEDQGYLAAEYFSLNEPETFYFVLLIQRERAGHHKLQKLLDRRIASLSREAQKVKTRIVTEKELSFELQAVFYSDWLFTAIHTLSSIPQFQSVDAIAEHLKVPRPRVVEAANWLLQYGLCKEVKGRLVMGPATTFVERGSSLARRHHGNWRQKAIEAMSKESEESFFFTAPFSISKDDYKLIRKELVQLIDSIAKRVGKTSPEMMATINVDLFET